MDLIQVLQGNFFLNFFAHSIQKSGLAVQIISCPFKIDVLTGIATWNEIDVYSVFYMDLIWVLQGSFFLTFLAQESVTASQNVVEPLRLCLNP